MKTAERIVTTVYLSMAATVGVLGIVTTLAGLIMLVTGSPEW